MTEDEWKAGLATEALERAQGDWEKLNGAALVVRDAMARQQRRAMEAQQRKGALRAV